MSGTFGRFGWPGSVGGFDEDAPAPRYASRSLYETVEVRSRLPIESCIISINSRSPCCAIDL